MSGNILYMMWSKTQMSDIKTVWEGQFVKVDLVDTTTECTIADNVYSLTEMMDLHHELVEAFDVAIKELKVVGHEVSN